MMDNPLSGSQGPDKKDMASGTVAAIALFAAAGLGMIFLLPLVIAGVILVWIIRRAWRVGFAFILYKLIRRKLR